MSSIKEIHNMRETIKHFVRKILSFNTPILTSINSKVIFVYIFLAVLNISFFTVVVFENQTDLISDNIKYQAEELIDSIIASLDKSDVFHGGGEDADEEAPRRASIMRIAEIIGSTVKDYLIFSEEGEQLFKSRESLKSGSEDVRLALQAIAGQDFIGRRHYSHVNQASRTMSFYIPYAIREGANSPRIVLCVKLKMDEIGERMKHLYRQIVIFILTIIIFHIVFAVVIYRLLIKPIHILHDASNEISSGNYEKRVPIYQRDEIGDLGVSFNNMASAIQDTIRLLQQQRDTIEMELDMAQEIQKTIFPEITENEKFIFYSYQKSHGKVCGDYYDIFPIGDDRYGFLIVDITGHGIPAALGTMFAKVMFRQYTSIYDDPAQLLQAVNSNATGLLNTFFTAFYIIVNSDNSISFSNAAHRPPFLIRMKQKKLDVLRVEGILMGVDSATNEFYYKRKQPLESGDKIIMFTDGLIEARNDAGDEYGPGRLLEAIKSSFFESGNDIIRNVIDDLNIFTNNGALNDDLTLFIIEMK